ncbi:hypothetical protein T439DRAFT_320873 [Meredithblackwellia eburnea MCA 4105]
MVGVQFTSKVAHFAPSFRPQQTTFNFTRNAFPPAPPPPPSAHHPGPRSQSGTGKGDGQRKGNETKGKDRGAWGFQTRLVAQPPASNPSDLDGRFTDEDDPNGLSTAGSGPTQQPQVLRIRPSKFQRPLLNAEEIGIVNPLTFSPSHSPSPSQSGSGSSTPLPTSSSDGKPTLSRSSTSKELHETYRLAFLNGERTGEVDRLEREMEMVQLPFQETMMEKEADELDFTSSPSSISGSGKRRMSSASLRTPFVPLPLLASVGPRLPVSHHQQARGIHSDSSSPLLSSSAQADFQSQGKSTSTPVRFPLDVAPPSASLPRRRRHSTSAAPEPAVFSTSPLSYTPTPPPSTIETIERHDDALKRALSRRDSRLARSALRAYLAHPRVWNTNTHNLALDVLLHTRAEGESIADSLEVYGHFFAPPVEGDVDTPDLRPNLRTYNLILSTFTKKEAETRRLRTLLSNRVEKRKLAGQARGPWHDFGNPDDTYLTPHEAKLLEDAQDYLSPAIKIYTAIGSRANRLGMWVMNQLLFSVARQGRVDLALSIFQRLERSPFQQLSRATFEALIFLYGQIKDKEGVESIFNAYLAARQSHLGPESPQASERTIRNRVQTKHAFGADVSTTRVKRNELSPAGDESLWMATIRALFTCDEPAAAVALLDRLLEAQQKDDIPAGYPTAKNAGIFNAVALEFVRKGDAENAFRWFDKIAYLNLNDPNIYRDALSASLEKGHVDLANKFYSIVLDNASRRFQVRVTEFITIVDFNLARFHSLSRSENAAERSAILDTVRSFYDRFMTAAAAGYHGSDWSVDDELGTGFSSRLTYAFGGEGRFEDSTDFALNTARAVLRAIRSATGSKSNLQWCATLEKLVIPASLGFLPVASTSDIEVPPGLPFPPVGSTATLLAITSELDTLVPTREPFYQSELNARLVESYLDSRAKAQGDLASLNLSPKQWFAVIRAFALTALSQSKRRTVPSNFPGFEPIIDDFFASGVSLTGRRASHDFIGLQRILRKAGMEKTRVNAVIAILDPDFAESLAKSESTEVFEPDTPSASPSSVDPLASNTFESQSIADTHATSQQDLPTPPPTPPTYFSSEYQHHVSSLPDARSISAEATRFVSDLVFKGEVERALAIAIEEATTRGSFVHPDTLGALMERLGRQGRLEEVRQVYLLAYEGLGLVDEGSEAQASSWALLEDRMMVALAHLGQLEEVAEHRLRLINAGSAPSADAYAAMILNMKETTNDAAVALELFEEAERLGVAANVYLFNTLISKLSRARRAREVLEYFDLMKEKGLRPSPITFGAVINACCKTGDDVSAEALFKEMVNSEGFKPRVPPYNTMIQFYTQTKPDRERALAYYDAMLKVDVKPTSHTYKLLLDAYGLVGETDAPSLSAVFEQLLKDPSVEVNGAHWASLITAWGAHQKDLPRATSIFESIAEHPSTLRSKSNLPDAVVYESILNACIANGQPQQCLTYLEDMKRRGVHLTAYVCNSLITAHAAQNDMESARAVFESMEDPAVGVAAAGNHPVDRHPKHHHLSGQSNILPATAPVFREPSTWTAMVQSEVAAGELGRAGALLARLESRAFPEAVVNKIRKLLEQHGLESQ